MSRRRFCPEVLQLEDRCLPSTLLPLASGAGQVAPPPSTAAAVQPAAAVGPNHSAGPAVAPPIPPGNQEVWAWYTIEISGTASLSLPAGQAGPPGPLSGADVSVSIGVQMPGSNAKAWWDFKSTKSDAKGHYDVMGEVYAPQGSKFTVIVSGFYVSSNNQVYMGSDSSGLEVLASDMVTEGVLGVVLNLQKGAGR